MALICPSPVYFCCPETQGKSLEEIDLVFVSQALKDHSAAAQTLYRGGEGGGDIEGGRSSGIVGQALSTGRVGSSGDGSLEKDVGVGEKEIWVKES